MLDKRILTILAPLSLFNFCTYATDKKISPPPETKWVNVEIKNPSIYTNPFPLEVRYISHKCMKKRISGFDGSVITEPDYNVIKIPVQQRSGDIWQGKVAMNGGGSCNWTLSAVTLGIEYIDANHLGKDLIPGTAVGATIAFDNDASRNGQFDYVHENNIVISPQYYPLIHKNKRIQEKNTLNIFGEEDFQQKKITDIEKGVNIIYTPKLDESKVVMMVAPMEYKPGSFYSIIYPDGEIVSDGSTHPDILKMQK